MDFNLYEKAQRLFLSGEYDEAEKIFESIPNLMEYCDEVHDYGICLIRLGKYDKAYEIFDLIVKKYPDFGQAWYSLGRTCLIKGYIQQAIDCFSCAKNIIFDDADVYFYSALCYEKIKKYEQAIEEYKISLELNNNFQTHINLGLCYYDVGDIESSLEQVEEAFKLNPKDLDALRYYVYILIKANKRNDAYNTLLNSDLNFDEDATILELLVLLSLDCKNFDLADKTYIKLKKAEDDSVELFDYDKFRKIAHDNLGDVFAVK